jgi:hypothetical protein
MDRHLQARRNRGGELIMPRYNFTITIGASADTPEEAWIEAAEYFALEPGEMPEEFTEEEGE